MAGNYKIIFIALLVLSGQLLSNTPPCKKAGKAKHSIEIKDLALTSEPVKIYQPSDRRIWDLIHARLDLTPVFSTRQIKGKAFLKLCPYVLPQQQLRLDAVNFSDVSVKMILQGNKVDVVSSYDLNELVIDLPKVFSLGDTLELEISYTTNTYTITQNILDLYDGRGAYFIDPFNKNPYKPVQLWTQGESRTARCWFPTIDTPAERCSQEMYITVDTSYTTLSNGLFINSTIHTDGTKTDYWRQDLDHPPYLFMMTIGEFVRVKDADWQGKIIDYYTQPGYEQYVKEVFKNTTRMLDFYSSKLGVAFPWDKYSQAVVYDYTAGAMENTSASLFYEPLYATDKDLIDNNFDDIIAHEMIHQWFGDLLNIESWGNLAMKESFADFGELLWYEYDLGSNEYGYKLWQNAQQYLYGYDIGNEPIINFYYTSPKDLYDNIRYEKGGYVLQMLRRQLGDQVFFKGLHNYIVKHAFQSIEIHDFRLAMEETSGEDLNWFFNQWFFGYGYPKLAFTTTYDAIKKVVSVEVTQEQAVNETNVFKFPLAFDVYSTSGVKRQHVIVNQTKQTFYLSATEKPLFVNTDAEKTLLCTKTTIKPIQEWILQYKMAPLFADKMEALENISRAGKAEINLAQQFWPEVLTDSFWVFRKKAIKQIDLNALPADESEVLSDMVLHDPHPAVRKAALEKLADFNAKKYRDLFELVWEQEQSPSILAADLQELMHIHKEEVLNYAERFYDTRNEDLLYVIGKIGAKYGGKEQLDVMNKVIWLSMDGKATSNFNNYYDYLIRQDQAIFKKGVDVLSDIYYYEQSNAIVHQAGNALQRLEKTIEEKLSKGNLSSTERKSWEVRQAIIKENSIDK